MRGDGGGAATLLACASFRDDTRLAHFHCEQALADSVIYFVRAGVEQILTLEVDARAAKVGREARSKLQRRGTAGEILQEIGEIGLKAGICFCGFVGALEFEQRHHKSFGNVAAAVGAETSGSERG